MNESLLDCVRDEVALRLGRGSSLVEVQNDVIEAAPGLSDDEQAGLWLFAWAYEPCRARNAKPLRLIAE